MEQLICSHYEQERGSKACIYYSLTKLNKIGLCKCKMKLTFLCHYSEKFLGTYDGDARIVSADVLK
jgi:hypothetical protein